MNAEISKNLYGKTVAVAVSGGEDSMALLHFTVNFCARFRIKVVALNVEHGIRGETSLRDSAFVKDYCKTIRNPSSFLRFQRGRRRQRLCHSKY